MELSCAVKNYAWGQLGEDSLVSQLAVAGGHIAEVDLNQSYAELWLGSIHSSGPSQLKLSAKPLAEHLDEDPSSLGAAVRRHFGALPFLFKVLSVRQPLSIQAHPSKETAKQLHQAQPELYPDPNHKPEMAIALSPFQVLCGFRPLEEIVSFTTRVPELATVLGQEAVQALRDALDKPEGRAAAVKTAFSALMKSDPGPVSQLVTKLAACPEQSALEPEERDLVLMLHRWFPNDIGCLAAFFLNHLELSPGQAIFLGPGVPHAYLHGDCVECMANSDNVVRAGLTPKHRDVATLCRILDYTRSAPAPFLPIRDPTDSCLTLYNPPVSDFAVYHIKVSGPRERYEGPQLESGSVLLVLEGGGWLGQVRLSRGSVLFLPCGTLTNILNIPDSGLEAFLACCCGLL